MEFGISEIEGLKNLLGVEEEEGTQHSFGSTLNPAKIGIGANTKDEVAKPHTKINVKVNNRQLFVQFHIFPVLVSLFARYPHTTLLH